MTDDIRYKQKGNDAQLMVFLLDVAMTMMMEVVRGTVLAVAIQMVMKVVMANAKVMGLMMALVMEMPMEEFGP